MKQNFLWSMTAIMMMICANMMTGCVNEDNSIEPGNLETVDPPQIAEPTEDQMSVTVSADLPTVVIGNLSEGSTGAALVRRLPRVTASFAEDTRMVLLPGSAFDEGGLTSEQIDAIINLSLNGGYIAIERPTQEQLRLFGELYAERVPQELAEKYKDIFGIDERTALRAAQSSPKVQQVKARLANIQNVSTTRASATGSQNEVQAEMVILGSTDYFMQEPLRDESLTYTHSTDSEGNTTEPVAVTVKNERTPYRTGLLADAAAEWLNTVEDPLYNHNVDVPNGSTTINEIMDASETFTYKGDISWRAWGNKTYTYYNRVNINVRSWGVHSMESNKDYYYVKQSVTLKMGNEYGYHYFYPLDEGNWYPATNYGNYNEWYGSFLSQYVTSLSLTGKGNIHLEASSPSTDNNTQSTSVNIGSSTSETTTVGISWGTNPGFNMSGPTVGINVGGSYSYGTTTGTSFTTGMTTVQKDFAVKKNTSGTAVTWTYNGTLPKYYEKTTDLIYYCHQTPADILVNDCDVSEEICWSVDNPSGQYTVGITSTPQTAALLFQYIQGTNKYNLPHTYEYTTTPTENYSHTLLEPNRAMQKWRMNVTIDEWEGTPVVGALGDLEDVLRKNFSDIYASVFSVADKTATSLNSITAIIDYSKKIFNQRKDILQGYAKSYTIKQFTIHWTCDDLNVKTREGLTIVAD